LVVERGELEIRSIVRGSAGRSRQLKLRRSGSNRAQFRGPAQPCAPNRENPSLLSPPARHDDLKPTGC
jgi:hypothetical protein